jgi:hypothetical protein
MSKEKDGGEFEFEEGGIVDGLSSRFLSVDAAEALIDLNKLTYSQRDLMRRSVSF